MYWELGVRQSFKHGTVTIAETRKQVAFDMGMKSILRYYQKNAMKNDEFVSDLKRAIIDCIEKPHLSDSTVLDTISGRGTIYQIIYHDELNRRLDALKQEIMINEDIFIRIHELVKINNELRKKKQDKKQDKKQEKKQKDEEEKEQIQMTSQRLIFSSLDLLLTNRYLDKSDEFYKILSNYKASVISINYCLDCWYTDSENWEKWFEKAKKTHENVFIALIEAIDIIYYQFKNKLIN